jgi:hypothetical protein
MVRQQFYANTFDSNGNHPTAFAWLPPEYYAAMLARGNG